jgi:hypothetical protein
MGGLLMLLDLLFLAVVLPYFIYIVVKHAPKKKEAKTI